MKRIQKSVFICYRRKDISWALLVYQYLTQHEYDVFFDYKSISSGDFEQIIIGNIKARAHFLVILTPSALDRCTDPEDWLRREIETAIIEKRNVIPLFFDGFSFGTSSILEKLSGELKKIKRYNGLDVPGIYFDEAMNRLCTSFLNVALDAVIQPVSDEVRKVIEEHQMAANEAIAQQSEAERLSHKKTASEAAEKHAREKIRAEPFRGTKQKGNRVLQNIVRHLKRSPLLLAGGTISVLVALSLAIWLGANAFKEDIPVRILSTESITPTSESAETTLPLPISTERAMGISVSFLNYVDWNRQKEDGIAFAFIRATQGETIVDTKFHEHWSGAASVGIPRGAYHSYDPAGDPSKQIDNFIQAFEEAKYDGELPPVVELKYLNVESNEEFLSSLQTALTEMESETGWKPIVYVESDFLNDNLRVQTGKYPDWLAEFPLWIGQYPADITNIETQQPYLSDDWPHDWAFWKYLNGAVGLEHHVDLNLFNGSPADLQRFISTRKFIGPLDFGKRAWGIDVLKYQGIIDWTRVKNRGVTFVYVKATGSETDINPAFDDHWLGAKAVGIPRGAYHMFDPDRDPVKQADIFIQTVRAMSDNAELPPVLDLYTVFVSDQSRQSHQFNPAARNGVKIWLDRVEEEFGRKPIIYSSLSFLNEYFSDPASGPPEWVKDYMLWIAEYYPGTTEPILPRGWTQWTFWQYTDNYTVDGVETPVTLNIFNGTPDDLQELLGAP